MSEIRIIPVIMLLAVLLVGLQGCYKVTTFVVAGGTEVTEEVSLTKDIQPIFNNSCNSSGCHNAGGLKPDLSEGNSFNALTNGGYINQETPEESELYLWLSGERSTAMPPSGTQNPSNINQLVLAWIKQGANNN